MPLVFAPPLHYTTSKEDNQQGCLIFQTEAMLMSVTFIVTGAAGHLGSTIVRLLSQAGQNVRALSLAGEAQRARRLRSGAVSYTQLTLPTIRLV